MKGLWWQMLWECGTDVNLQVPDILRNSVQVGRVIDFEFFVSEEVKLTADVLIKNRDESLFGVINTCTPVESLL
jgi:hypothetical protein